ncbi:class I SAM-dependent methyltransferase [Corynebacterium yudongzhengii]|uniref:Class I SAM-dependent methyltransferase n=1 Tax=Corynebacterium yudongzhengii TaxID=2080740 RepID=A0A2U1T656_9CORY|nr:class I SAM-dependent methyltransferase [Corynebacterium yudongzhengii]AWB82986.1 class I SAM-dependent methyltransferase [Corynebacterium yudongzhengii]PWC01487.1 class I SAM-dependent methyltransferase [Corynebacterium yudongzhengii]
MASEDSAAHRRFWDADAARYHAAHRSYLDGFHWCPEMLTEAEAGLLGDVTGQHVLEIGCGSAPCANWLATHRRPSLITGFDISRGMLSRAHGPANLQQADVQALPYRSESFDIAFSAFGALPFIRDLDSALKEIHRVLRPGGRFVFAVNHPMRWIFPDDPEVMVAAISYFDRVYEEFSEDGHLTYAEYHRTFGDWVRALKAARLLLDDLIEPEWPERLEETWGQWSPQRGRIFPGTAIFLTSKG